MARGGRRRRVLNEEARAASNVQATISMTGGADAPRYGELACIEHHPQISDYVPRRKRAVVAVLASGATTGALTLALRHGAEGIAGNVPGVNATQLAEQLAGGVVAWTSAIAMLAVAGLARLAYSLRRHRVDDVRGRYRVWKWVIGGAAALSVNAVVGVQSLVSSVALAATGWSLTASGAEWWLTPTTIVGVWIAVRLALEIAESRGSLTMMIVAAACYAAAGAGFLGWSPVWLGAWGDALTWAAPLVGHAFALAGMMWFARYVVLDVQGLIEHSPRPTAETKKQPPADKAADSKAIDHSAAPATIPARREPAAAARWQQDVEDEADDEDESAGQYLSKSERKRQRKQQRRAA